MPDYHSKARKRSIALVLLFGVVHAAVAEDSSWFGPACSNDAVNVVPAGIQEMLVAVHSEPLQLAESETLLQTTNGDLWISPDSLKRWHVPVPKESLTRDGVLWAPLRAVQGLHYRFDSCTQELWVDTAGTKHAVSRYDLGRQVAIPEGSAAIESGGYFNLDTQLLHSNNRTQWAGLGELGLFNAWGYGATTFVADTDHATRLETNWTQDDPEFLHRLTLGDAITRGSNFGQPVRFGGLQWGRQFSLRPDFITYPLPSFRGNAALASSVDVYVNQSLRSNQDVSSGPFELNRVPVISGQGQVQLVIRDVLGREQVVSYPFYAAPILLQEDLTDYTLETGWVRNNYTTHSFDYGRFLTAGTYRKGITHTFTAEAHSEILHEQQLFAVSGAWLQPSLGVFSAGLAGSGTAVGAGSGMQLGFERISGAWSFAAELRRGTPRFTRVGDGSDSVRRSELLRLGFVPHPGGSLSFNYLHQRRQSSGDVSILGITYSYGFARDWILFVNTTQARAQSRDYNVLIGLNWQFGQNLLATSEFSHEAHNNIGRFTVQRNMENALDYSWRASMETGENARRTVHADWGQERGFLSADAEHFAGNNSYRLGYTTGVAWLGTDTFWTRRVDGSFAVVDVQGVPGVRIYTDERLAGRTDAQGKLLIPNLRTYETTNLRIEDGDVPIEYEISDLHHPLFLPTRGGTRALFSIKSLDGFVVKLHQADGRPVPAGARVMVPGLAEELPVGFEGQAYLSRPSSQNRLEAQWVGHRCVAHWLATSEDVVSALCEEVKP